MKIACDFSHDTFVSCKEGICVYNAFLFQSLLKNFSNLELEIYTLEINIPELIKSMDAYYETFKKRISFITPLWKVKKFYKIPYLKCFFHILKYIYYSTLFCLTKKQKFSKKIQKTSMNLKLLSMEISKDLPTLASESNANIVFIDHGALKLGHFFKIPKVFMCHDLFTIPFANLFRELYPNIDFLNKQSIENLSQYAKEGTFFVTSAKYIQDQQLLKYIKELKPEMTSIIPYPPMLHNFSTDSIASENDIRFKFDIKGKYIFYPSQNRPNKNIILLLKALNHLKKEKIEISVVTTGDFYLLPKCANFIKENELDNYILQVGAISEKDLYALYKYSSMVVVPTIIEGPGMPQQVLEPLKIGNIPVICTKCYGVKESLESVGLSMNKADLNWVDLDDDITLSNKIKDVLAFPPPPYQKTKRHHLCLYQTFMG